MLYFYDNKYQSMIYSNLELIELVFFVNDEHGKKYPINDNGRLLILGRACVHFLGLFFKFFIVGL